VRPNLLFRALVPVLAVLHFFLHTGLGLGRGVPDLLTLALLLGARELRMGGAAGLGFFFGILRDSFSTFPFGVYSLALTVVGALGAATRDLFVGDSLRFLFSYLVGGKLLLELGVWALAGEAVRGPFVDVVLVAGGISALYGAVVGILLILPFWDREGLR
jgi:rod shape-determining protein MreD